MTSIPENKSEFVIHRVQRLAYTFCTYKELIANILLFTVTFFTGYPVLFDSRHAVNIIVIICNLKR